MPKSNCNSGFICLPLLRSSSLVFALLIVSLGAPQIGMAQNFGLDGGDAAPTRKRANNFENQSGVSADGKFDVSVSNGTRTIKVKDLDRDVEIVEDRNGPISVMVSRTYTSNDMDELAKKSPKLAEYLRNVPASVDGLDVDVSVRLSNSGSADSSELLEANHKGLYNIYKRYVREIKSVDLVSKGGSRRGAAGAGPRARNGQFGYRPGMTATSKNYNLPTAQVGPDASREDPAENDNDDNDQDR